MHGRPLSEATIGLALFLESPPAPADAEAWLDLVLSEQPPDLRQARLRYLVAGEPEGHRPEERRASDPRLPAGGAGRGMATV